MSGVLKVTKPKLNRLILSGGHMLAHAPPTLSGQRLNKNTPMRGDMDACQCIYTRVLPIYLYFL